MLSIFEDNAVFMSDPDYQHRVTRTTSILVQAGHFRSKFQRSTVSMETLGGKRN